MFVVAQHHIKTMQMTLTTQLSERAIFLLGKNISFFLIQFETKQICRWHFFF
jgi:hypothetical protein